MIPTTITALAPKRATTGTSTTVIAPVGPDTCTLEPPNTAATSPGDDGGHQPGLRAEPGGDAEAERERERDDTDGHAGDEIAAPRTAHTGVVGAARHHRRDSRADAHERPAALRPARSSVDSLNDTIMKRFAAARSSASSGARSE